MVVSLHAIYWGAYMCLFLMTLLVLLVVVVFSKMCSGRCDPLREYVVVVKRPRSPEHGPEMPPAALISDPEAGEVIALEEKHPSSGEKAKK